jgi:hypothetical protein
MPKTILLPLSGVKAHMLLDTQLQKIDGNVPSVPIRNSCEVYKSHAGFANEPIDGSWIWDTIMALMCPQQDRTPLKRPA